MSRGQRAGLLIFSIGVALALPDSWSAIHQMVVVATILIGIIFYVQG